MVCLFLTMAHKSQPILPELRFRRRSPLLYIFHNFVSVFFIWVWNYRPVAEAVIFHFLQFKTNDLEYLLKLILNGWREGDQLAIVLLMKRILKRINNIFSIMRGHFDKFKQWLSLCVCKLPCLAHDYKALDVILDTRECIY